MSARKPQYHLHLETGRKRPAIFHLTEEKWIEATKRHRLLAKKLKVTIGWDNEILEQSLQSADFMINSFPPKMIYAYAHRACSGFKPRVLALTD